MPVVHTTPGLIDVRAFTTFGVNSKPNSKNPIGYFGTGLKYAVAVLARHMCPVTVWIGTEPHVFYADKMTFRDKDFLQLRMRRQRGATARWMSTELPFTTELGKNWELWMALRELHSNTLDEGGMTSAIEDGEVIDGEPGCTKIVVEGDAYAQAHDELTSIFLSTPPAASSDLIEMRSGQSNWVYYRGLRVHKLRKPSCLTWNIITPSELTEDRTLKWGFMVEHWIASYVMSNNDEKFIKSMLLAPENTLEHDINWDNQSCSVSPAFVNMARLYGGKNTTVIVRRETEREERAKVVITDWRQEMVMLLRESDDTALLQHCRQHSQSLQTLLLHSLEADDRHQTEGP